jgi:CO/xanthine dehydrogenase FAD-binding subunit
VDLPGITEVTDARSATWRDGDAWLAGGTWLFSEPQPSLRRLLDLQGFGWPALTAGPAGLEIAATCTLAELARFRAPQWPASPLIGQCCAALLGSFKVWNAATVGGNLCLALPAGPMISLATALDGVCTVWGPDRAARRLPAADFVTGPGRCALAPGELLRSVHLPARALAGTTAFRQLSLSALGRSAAVVIGRRAPPDAGLPDADLPDAGPPDGGVVITVTAATERPVQLRFGGLPTAAGLLAALDDAAPRWHDDVHGAPAWRAAVTRQLAVEVLDELAAGAAP